MAKIKIITDSTAYISKEFIEENGIKVVPLSYTFGEETRPEGFKGEFDEFYRKLETTDLFPKTSQPPAGEFVNAFNESFEDYDEVIVIVLSSKISGTYNSATLAKNMLEDKKVTVIDSETTLSNQRVLVEDALRMANEGKTSEEIEEYLNQKKKRMRILLSPATLEYLRRGGRLSGVSSTIGNLLNLKPILELKDGVLNPIDKVRGTNKAIAYMIDEIPDDAENISICHILNIDGAEKVKKQLEERFPNIDIAIDDIGPVIGAHLGPKTVGICYY